MRAHPLKIQPCFFLIHRRRHTHEPSEPQKRIKRNGFRERIQVLTGDAAFLVLRPDVDLDENILNDRARLRFLVELAHQILPVHRLDQVGKTADIFYLIRLQLSNKMHSTAMLFKKSFLFVQFLGVILSKDPNPRL